LIEAVRKGRIEEFAAFRWQGEPADPQAESSFMRSKLDLELRHCGKRRQLFEFYRELIRLRQTTPSLRTFAREGIEVRTFWKEGALLMRRREGPDQSLSLFNLREGQANLTVPFPEGEWDSLLDSNSPLWGGLGSTGPAVIASSGQKTALSVPGYSVVLYRLRDTPGVQEEG
jgi:maltooligosyltrehalose trehalohydrolase